MIGLGTIINTIAIVFGGIAGHLSGRLLKERHQETLSMACGVSVLFIGIAGAMEGMLSIENGTLNSGQAMLVVISIALGAFIGEIINIEGWFERFGEWLKVKTGNSKDENFVNGFVTASLTVCIGAMAIVGAIQDGILGDYTILATKAVLDLIIIMVMTCSLGKGCVFSALPVFAFEMGTEEAVYHAFQVLSDGGVVIDPIHELPWSKCCATVIDRYGVCWWISI